MVLEKDQELIGVEGDVHLHAQKEEDIIKNREEIKMVKNPFKKKKKKEEVPEAPEVEQVETPIVEAKTEGAKSATAEEKELLKTIKEYKKYQGVFAPADFLQLKPDTEVCNLLFAIFAEIRKLREDLKK